MRWEAIPPISDRLRHKVIAAAFGGFFGSQVVGAIGAYEYMFIKELNFYRHVIPGLVAASVGYSVYFAILHTQFLGIFSFPTYASPMSMNSALQCWSGLSPGSSGSCSK